MIADRIQVIGYIVLGGLSAYFTVLLMVHGSLSYAPGLAVAALFFYMAARSSGRAKDRERRRSVEEGWGRPLRRKRDLQGLSKAYEKIGGLWENSFAIDDRTWEDLNMDDVFGKLDRTLTAAGQQVLYRCLRRPLLQLQDLLERNRRIQLFAEDAEVRRQVRFSLDKLGIDDGEGAVHALWERLPEGQISQVTAGILAAGALAAPLLFFWSPPQAFMVVAVVFSLNMSIHYREQKIIENHFSSLKFVSRLVRTGQELEQLDDPSLEPVMGDIRRSTGKLKALPAQVGLLGSGRTGGADNVEVLLQYVSIFFLLEVRSYRKARALLERHKESAQSLFLAVGELDLAQSTASYRSGLEIQCKPELGAESLQMEDAYHPLLEDPVANSLTVKNSRVLITGSNMSGKSTFLRTLGINALLAQSLFFCHAKRYASPFVQLMTSIGRSDNVVEGRSYYLVEALAVRRIIDQLDPETVTLAIIDEIFRGTNSEERIKASAGVLRYLGHHNCLVFCATHDLELVDILGSAAENYHFREQLSEEEGLHFDYKLHQGPSTTRNALKLLRYLGYPEAVTGE